MLIPIPLKVLQLGKKKDLKKFMKTVWHKIGVCLICGDWKLILTNMPSFQKKLQVFSSN